jgi:hypothetical protein
MRGAEPGDAEHGGSASARTEPDGRVHGVRDVIGRPHAGKRCAEQDETGDREHDGELLAPRQSCGMPACTGERQHRDPARADRLHERERSKPERGEVHEPPDRLGAERRQPATAAQERCRGPDRAPRRKLRQGAHGIVLPRIRPVHGDRRDERQPEPYPDSDRLLLAMWRHSSEPAARAVSGGGEIRSAAQR